jgi:hypothetical protein
MTNKINGKKSWANLLVVLTLAVMVMGTASAASHPVWVGSKNGFAYVDDGVKLAPTERTDGKFVWTGSKNGFTFVDNVKISPTEGTDGKSIWMGSKNGFEFVTWNELKNNPKYHQVQ